MHDANWNGFQPVYTQWKDKIREGSSKTSNKKKQNRRIDSLTKTQHYVSIVFDKGEFFFIMVNKLPFSTFIDIPV